MTTTAQYLATLQRKYGITSDEYRALYYAQGGACYVCRKATGRTRRLGVDHDHLTGEVRGLVCTGSISAMTCNRLIAIYGREQLLRAVAMLSDPPPARAILARMRSGETRLPSLVGGEAFDLADVRRVELAGVARRPGGTPEYPQPVKTSQRGSEGGGRVQELA